MTLKCLLLVGFDLVALARAARAAGFKVYAADYFGDYDLIRVCEECKAIIEQKAGKSYGKIENCFDPIKFVDLARIILKKASVDAILLSSGLDDSFEILEELDELAPILGNKPEIFRRVRDKFRFFQELKRLNLSYPETVIVKSFEDARKAAKDIGYPVVVKPYKGFAGVGVRKAENLKELEESFKIASLLDGRVIVQEYVAGVHASISLVSSSVEVKVLTVNEQLLGLREVGQRDPFGFCGNIVPLNLPSETFRKCCQMAERIALHFGLKGSNGIDFVLSSEGIPYVIEVNPRFQATLECVEQALGLNLVEMHVKACLNKSVPDIPYRISEYCTRLILFSKNRVRVGDLTELSWVRDIPFCGVIIEEGEPLCSVIAKADNRNLSFRKALKKANFVYDKFVTPI